MLRSTSFWVGSTPANGSRPASALPCAVAVATASGGGAAALATGDTCGVDAAGVTGAAVAGGDSAFEQAVSAQTTATAMATRGPGAVAMHPVDSRVACGRAQCVSDHGDVVGRIEVSFLSFWPRAV
jgi:hypothetical protein